MYAHLGMHEFKSCALLPTLFRGSFIVIFVLQYQQRLDGYPICGVPDSGGSSETFLIFPRKYMNFQGDLKTYQNHNIIHDAYIIPSFVVISFKACERWELPVWYLLCASVCLENARLGSSWSGLGHVVFIAPRCGGPDVWLVVDFACRIWSCPREFGICSFHNVCCIRSGVYVHYAKHLFRACCDVKWVLGSNLYATVIFPVFCGGWKKFLNNGHHIRWKQMHDNGCVARHSLSFSNSG